MFSSLIDFKIVKHIMGQTRSRNIEIDSGLKLLPIDRHSILDVKLNKKYNHLVFGSTKMNGHYGQLGVVIELMNQNYLKNVKTITCAGFSSILGLMLALGYTIDEILSFYKQHDFTEICNTKKELQSDICHFAVNLARNNGQELSNVITEIIEKRTGNKNYSLSDLFEERNMTFNVVIVDLTTKSHLMLNAEHHGNVPLRIAVRIACGFVPQIAPVIYDEHYFTGAHDMNNVHHLLFPVHDPFVLTIDAVCNEVTYPENILTPLDLIEALAELYISPAIKCDICNLQRICIKIKDSNIDRLLSDAALEVYNWQ